MERRLLRSRVDTELPAWLASTIEILPN